ncbi:MAG: hypothetical protein ACE5HP_03570 [Gemmatimonadota bacterium]
MIRYRRGPARMWEELAAAAVGVVCGLATFYVTRLWLQREPLEEEDAELGSRNRPPEVPGERASRGSKPERTARRARRGAEGEDAGKR